MNKNYLTLGLCVALVVFSAVSVYGLRPASFTWQADYTYQPTQTATSYTAKGGNITAMNLVANESTIKWAGIYGNISGNIYLANGSNVFYRWTWNNLSDGEVCASENSTLPTALANVQAYRVDAVWVFEMNDSDAAVNTFNITTCNITRLMNTNLASGNSTMHNNQDFGTCVLNTTTGNPGDEASFWFCSVMYPDNSCWDSKPCMYELMVPTTKTAGATETYYMYVELG